MWLLAWSGWVTWRVLISESLSWYGLNLMCLLCADLDRNAWPWPVQNLWAGWPKLSSRDVRWLLWPAVGCLILSCPLLLTRQYFRWSATQGHSRAAPRKPGKISKHRPGQTARVKLTSQPARGKTDTQPMWDIRTQSRAGPSLHVWMS